MIAVAAGVALNQLAAARGMSGVVTHSDIKLVQTISQNQAVPAIQTVFAQAGPASLPLRARPHKTSSGNLVWAPTMGMSSMQTMQEFPELAETFLARAQTELNKEFVDEDVVFEISAAKIYELAKSFDGNSQHGCATLQTILHWPWNETGQRGVAHTVEKPHAISAAVAVQILLGDPVFFSDRSWICSPSTPTGTPSSGRPRQASLSEA